MATRIWQHRLQLLVVLLVLVLALIVLWGPARSPRPAWAEGTYLLCFWNVENLFDDRRDGYSDEPDREYDRWFARDDDARHRKLDRLSEALIELNHGRGPDILALTEVEGERAVELLRGALNARLSDPALHYSAPVLKDVGGGRHISPALLTRLPVERDRTRQLRKQYRVLETRLRVNGQELVVIAAHWSSRLSDRTGNTRAKYADLLYGEFRAMYRSNPQVDLLICGDFNDSPGDPSVSQHLHAVGDRAAVLRSGGDPLLFNLSANRDPKRYGTHYYRRWYVYDQIVVSPGLLDDQGWTVVPDSLLTVNTLTRRDDRLQRPWRFGDADDKGERGYSDHFPVTVQLRVNGSEAGGQ